MLCGSWRGLEPKAWDWKGGFESRSSVDLGGGSDGAFWRTASSNYNITDTKAVLPPPTTRFSVLH